MGSLPKPAKEAATALLGVTAIGGGGFWLTTKAVTTVADLRESLTQLASTAPKAAAALRGLSLVGGATVAITGLLEAHNALQRSLDRTPASVTDVAQSLLKLDTQAGAQALVGQLGDLDAAFRKLEDPGFLNDLD